MFDLSERDIYVWLNSIGINSRTMEKLVSIFPDIRELMEIDSLLLYRLKNIRKDTIDKILRSRDKYKIRENLEAIKESGVDFITIVDSNYPESLRNIFDKPYVLYKKGNIIEDDKIAIGIVGARKSTPYGRWACEKFVKELVKMDVTIVSGLALGIDAVAHRVALEEGGRTIGILGNGLDQIYPKRNEYLYRNIVDNGAILSEFPLGTLPLPYNFPQRNRIIAGLSLGIIVIEAKEKSGSLITAHHALEQGKDIFALPGNINSIYSGGTNKLIKDGARPLLDIEDLLEEISELEIRHRLLQEKKIDYSNLSESERKIVDTIKDGPIHCDMIAYKTGFPISTIIATLTILELKGIVKEFSNQVFTLN